MTKVCSKCGKRKRVEDFRGDRCTRRSVCRECDAEYGRKWRRENKDKVKVYEQRWRRENKDRKRETNRKWVARNKERVHMLQKQWCERNKEAMRASNKKHRLANKEKRACYARSARADLKPHYVRHLIRDSFKFSGPLPDSLVRVVGENIKMKRSICKVQKH